MGHHGTEHRLTHSTRNCSRENGRAFETTLLIDPIEPPTLWLEADRELQAILLFFDTDTNNCRIPFWIYPTCLMIFINSIFEERKIWRKVLILFITNSNLIIYFFKILQRVPRVYAKRTIFFLPLSRRWSFQIIERCILTSNIWHVIFVIYALLQQTLR